MAPLATPTSLMIGITRHGAVHTDADNFDLDTGFRVVREAGVFDCHERTPPPAELGAHLRASQRHGLRHGLPIRAGGFDYTLGRDQALPPWHLHIVGGGALIAWGRRRHRCERASRSGGLHAHRRPFVARCAARGLLRRAVRHLPPVAGCAGARQARAGEGGVTAVRTIGFAGRCGLSVLCDERHGGAGVELTVRNPGQLAQAQAAHDGVERVLEATKLLPGIGFDSGGLSLAHALVRGFSAHPVLGRFLHGEVIAFGTRVQRVARGRPIADVAGHAAWAQRLGRPANFAAFGIPRVGDDELDEIARITCTAPYIAHLQPVIDAAGVRHAWTTADRLIP